MSTSSSSPATGTATPRMSAAPPASSTTAANHAAAEAGGTPAWSKNAAVPSMPLVNSFCRPWATKTRPTATRVTRTARSRAGAGKVMACPVDGAVARGGREFCRWRAGSRARPLGRGKRRSSGDDGEPAGPGDLLAGGQGDLQEAERLQLAGAAQGAGVDGAQAGGGDDPGQQRLGLGVVAGDQHGGGLLAYGAGSQGGGEGGVERLDHAGLRKRRGDLGGGGAVGRDDQRVEGLDVQRVGDVDDDLAGQLLTALGDDVGDRPVVDREDDDLAGDRLVGVLVAKQLDGVAAPADDGGDCLTHVAGAEDAHVRHDGAPVG